MLRHARDCRRANLYTNTRRAFLFCAQVIEKEMATGTKKETKPSMLWVIFALGAALAWGLYGPSLHAGQVEFGKLGDSQTAPLRSLLCVGVAYFLIGVLFPLVSLGVQSELKGFNSRGITWATIGGMLGALGAICIIYAFKSGGIPTYVMPLVFGGAP